MKNRTILLLGLALMFIGAFGKPILENLPVKINEVEVIDIGVLKPSEEVSDSVANVSRIVTEDEDKLNIAIFNKVFAQRILTWDEVNQQMVNDVYVNAAKEFFGESLKGKYEGLDEFLISTMETVAGDEIHNLTTTEKRQISDLFYGISWHLIN